MTLALPLPIIILVAAILLAGVLIMWATFQRRLALHNEKLAIIREEYSNALNQQNEQAELFRALFDSAPECLKLQARDGTVERINAAGLSLLDTTQPSRIVGKSVYSVIAPDYHEQYRELTERVFQGHTGFMEFELVSFEGKQRWLETHAVPLRNRQQQVHALLAITRDISERKWMTQKLEEQRNRLHTIIDSQPECVKLHDCHGRISEMNPAGLSLLNAVVPQDVIGRSIYDFMLPPYQSEYRNLTQAVFGGERGHMEFEVRTLEGDRRWLETHAAPLYDSEGNVLALLAITRNINERKLAEEQLRQQQIELAHVCRLSTMGELASGLAHELNQPLCAISSYAESALQLIRPDDPGVDDLLQKIIHQAERTTQIIQRLRDFVRKQSPKPSPMDAQTLIKEVIQFVEPERRRRHICVSVRVPENLDRICADRIQIGQVLLNLVTNAMQAMQAQPEDQRRLSLVVSRETPGELQFCLCNSGQPVAAEHIGQLFTPFYTTKENGMGMGLAISRTIIEAHGGQISYSDNPAGGACFRFSLPTVS